MRSRTPAPDGPASTRAAGSSAAGPASAAGPHRALVVVTAVYAAYAALGLWPAAAELRSLGLIAAFYFVPVLALQRDPARARAWGIGPAGPVPPLDRGGRRGVRLALVAAALTFPPFIVGFVWFYGRACTDGLAAVPGMDPMLALERLTPWSGEVERFVARLCARHVAASGNPAATFEFGALGLWPAALRVPAAWLAYGGLGFLLAAAVEVFAVALPEEVFHRAYLMNALEERWPPRVRVFGVPFGAAAIASSLVFALGHLVAMIQLGRLATFFPGLLFAWLYRRSGSLWAPALYHAASNLLMAALLASTFPR